MQYIISSSKTKTKIAQVAFEAGDENRVDALGRLPERSYVVEYKGDLAGAECNENLRHLAYDLREALRRDKVDRIALRLKPFSAEQQMAFVEGLTLADYSFDRFKSKAPHHIASVTLCDVAFSEAELEERKCLWNRIFWCREWVNLPVADLNAVRFSEELASIAEDLGVKCTVFDKKKIEALRMGGLLAVNKGSVDEPRFVVLEYKGNPKSRKAPIALVGKGIMYDTGGLNLKPDDYMQEMKSDMAGSATMASVLFAAADNKLPVNLVALLPLTDSRPGFNAFAADDILTMYDGTTVEVVNTDAEGRVILADAIAYAVEKYNPSLLIDAATLTGAAVRAIATFGIAAIEQNADAETARLQAVGEQVYERLAMLPFWKEYDKMIESQVADLKNCGPGQAGTITAGKFLAHFAKQTPYIHLDIAGVAYFSKPQAPFTYGASGYGIRLLYEFLKNK